MTGPLAIIDWGVGGIGFYQAMRARHPDVPVLYFSDSGSTPYGKSSRPALAARLTTILTALAREEGVRHAVIACNAASTVLPDLQGRPALAEIAFTGVIAPAVAALATLEPQAIGVIGGRRTILSRVYHRALTAAGHAPVQRVAQPLSAFVEAGELATPRVAATIASILAPLKDVRTLVMACTHYPALASHFTACLPNATLFDPVTATLRWVEDHWSLPHGTAATEFTTTGDPEALQRAAAAAFGQKIVNARVTFA